MLEPVGRYVRRETDEFEALVAVRERRDRGRRARAVAVALAIVAVAAGLTSRVYWADEGSRLADTPTPDAEIVPPQLVPAGSTPYLLDLRTGGVRSLPATIADGDYHSFSPDGTMVAFASRDHSASPRVDNSLSVAQIDGTGLRLVPPDQANHPFDPRLDHFSEPRWSPDGTRLVYQARHSCCFGELFVVEVATGRTRQITDLARSGWYPETLWPDFGSDGNTVTFHLSGTTRREWDVWQVPVTGGDPVLVRENAAFLSLSPTGEQSIFLSSGVPGESDRIMISGADPASVARTLLEGRHIRSPRWSPEGARIAYVDRETIKVVEIATGESVRLVEGSAVDWVDEDTLIVFPREPGSN